MSGGYCPKHRAVAAARQHRQPAEVHRLYGRDWQRRRAAYLAGHPWCEECLRANIYTFATDVHHVIPHRGDPTIFRTSPLEADCKACHSKHTWQEIHGHVSGRGGKNV